MSQNIRYWLLILALNYLPTIGFHILIRPQWYKGVESFTSATTIETMFTIIFLPIYLVLINYIVAKWYKKTNILFMLNSVIILSCIFLSTFLHFKNWADSIGNYSNPDNETLEVMGFERSLGLIICFIGLIIIFFRLRSKRNKSVDIDKTE